MPKNKPVLESMPAVQGGKKIQYYNVKIPQNEYGEKEFECSINTVFARENQHPVSEIDSKIKFSVSKTEYGNGFRARFNIHSADVTGSNQEVLKLLDLNQLLSMPTKKIDCLLNATGKIKEILNAEQIHQKWKDVFGKLKRETTDEQFLMKVSDAGEKEFSNPISGIEKTQLYNLFFFPLFNKPFTYGTASKFNMMETSHLLNEQILDIGLSEKHLKIDRFYVTLCLEGSVLNDKDLFMESKKIFGSLLNQNSTYKGDISIKYQIDAENGYPVSIQSVLKESLTGVFFYEQKLEIKTNDKVQ